MTSFVVPGAVANAAPASAAAADWTQLRARHPGLSVETGGVAAKAWDRIAAGFDDITYDQTACFAQGQWGAARVDGFLLRDGEAVVGGAQVVVLKPPLLGHGLAYVKFGPFWRRYGEPADPEVYRSVVLALVAEYCDRQGHLLTILPRPNPDHHEAECRILAELGFAVRRPMQDPNRYLVDVSLGADAAMRSLAQKWRYNLKGAQANGIEVRLGEGEADLSTFAALHDAMVSRKKYDNPDALHLIPALSTGLVERMRPRTVLALHEGRPVAGAVVALLGDTAYYVFGASDDSALPLKAGYALQWWIACWLRDEGVRWYDLGGEALYPGLKQFKKGFVGRQGVVLPVAGEYDLWTSRRGRLGADAVYSVRAAKRAVRHLRRGR